MTEVDRLARDARISVDLAAMVAAAACSAGVSVRCFRSEDRRAHLVAGRRRLIVEARDRGFSLWDVARALNRDSSTICHHERYRRRPAEPQARPAPVQLEFLVGPLFDFPPAPRAAAHG